VLRGGARTLLGLPVGLVRSPTPRGSALRIGSAAAWGCRRRRRRRRRRRQIRVHAVVYTRIAPLLPLRGAGDGGFGAFTSFSGDVRPVPLLLIPIAVAWGGGSADGGSSYLKPGFG
jgi:hypothetical protein